MGSGVGAGTEARTTKRGMRVAALIYAHEPVRLHSCSKFSNPGSYYSNMSKYSTLYMCMWPTFPTLAHPQPVDIRMLEA